MSRTHRPLVIPFGKRARAVGLVTAAAVVLWVKPMGLLLWARLRILANIPRTAVADDDALLASRFEPPALPTLATPEVVVLPRNASRNPFAEANDSNNAGPRGSDSQRNPTPSGLLTTPIMRARESPPANRPRKTRRESLPLFRAADRLPLDEGLCNQGR